MLGPSWVVINFIVIHPFALFFIRRASYQEGAGLVNSAACYQEWGLSRKHKLMKNHPQADE
jgi:hypothetical protein